MAKQTGIFKVQGSLGGVTFYKRNGQELMKTTAGPSKSKIANSPSFQRTRENNQEFAGAAAAAKALRMGLVINFDEMTDGTAIGRLLKACKEIVSKGAGQRGQRSFIPSGFKDSLLGFIFNQSVSFDGIFLAPYTSAVNAARNEVSFNIPDFNTGNFVKGPSGATHFRIINLISVLSEYDYNVTSGKYEPLDSANNSKNAFSASDYLPLGTNVGAVTSIVSTLSGAPALAATSVLVSCIGIEFYQNVGGIQYLLASNNAMKIKDVF
jgi:hypothetical protein